MRTFARQFAVCILGLGCLVSLYGEISWPPVCAFLPLLKDQLVCCSPKLSSEFWLGLFTVHFASVGLNDFWKVEVVFGSPVREDTNYVFKVLAIYGKAASTGVYDLSEDFLIAAIGLWAPPLFFKLTFSIRLPIIRHRSLAVGINSRPGLASPLPPADSEKVFKGEQANINLYRWSFKLATTGVPVSVHKKTSV